jgi:hypothetical protein
MAILRRGKDRRNNYGRYLNFALGRPILPNKIQSQLQIKSVEKDKIQLESSLANTNDMNEQTLLGIGIKNDIIHSCYICS